MAGFIKHSFSSEIVETDKFLDMPFSAQCLYFHLGILARDKGELNNLYAIARGIGAGSEDVELLIANGYISKAENEMWRISDWYTNNTLSESSERLSYNYQRWRKDVLKRDDYKCRICGASQNLHVHHIKPFNKFKDKRTSIDNGVTLCRECHKRVHKEKDSEWLYLGE